MIRSERAYSRIGHGSHTWLQFAVVALTLLAMTTRARAQDASPVTPTQFTIEGPGDESINRFYGEFTERIPIVVPKYHGIEPELALHYHSNDGNGFVGSGWSLAGLSVVRRASPGRGAPTW